jgi:hypothetical protein
LAGALALFVTKAEQQVDVIHRERLGLRALELFPQTQTDAAGDHLVWRGWQLPIVCRVKP